MTRTTLVPAIFCTAVLLFACSEDPGPFFTPQRFPENQPAFDDGRLGLLTPDLRVEDQLIAYRLLSGLNLTTASEPIPNARPNLSQAPVLPVFAWQQARNAIATSPQQSGINLYRASHSSSLYVFYVNCLDDAFLTAAGTLNDRRQHYSSPADVQYWIAAQDQVFADCSSDKPQYPTPAAANAPPLVLEDRAYQIAAAHFYAEDLAGAEQQFRSIAADTQSPWHTTARYMIGRTLLRELSLQANTAAAPLARQQFNAIANDPAAGPLAASARGLVQHLDALENAAPVMASLSKQLLVPQASRLSLADTITQSAYILRTDTFKEARSQSNIADAFDWVRTLNESDQSNALDRWKSTHSLPWLTLALILETANDPSASTLIAEAARVPQSSPAFGTITYNAIRLRMEQGHASEPRQQLDTLLASDSNQPASLVNAWRAERLQLATSFDDLLQWAPRQPVYQSVFSAGDVNGTAAILAPDSVNILNYKTPLAKLPAAAHSPRLPAWSTSDIALATWTRAFLLNNTAVATDVAPIVAKDHPDWSSALTPAALPSDEWRFHAALLIALHKEFQPLIPVDYRKHMSQGSWWCPVTPPPGGPQVTISWSLPAWFTLPGSVLSKQEQSTAQSEVAQLQSLGSAPSFLAPIIFNWAKAHPDDPLVPQALHRLVIVVRYGCYSTDATNGVISKTAFDLLHQHYPNNKWTAQTPYWFK